MKDERGCKDFPLWLLGDSNPKNWENRLDVPLDTRHPAVHNIWTPILEQIQETVFDHSRLRVDASQLYVRNAVQNPGEKPKNLVSEWSPGLAEQVEQFRKEVELHQPRIVFSFGSFAFEFARRAFQEEETKRQGWSAKRMREEFRKRINSFEIERPTVLPLLHVSVARGRFLEAHKGFTDSENGNYFEHVAQSLARVLMDHGDRLKIIWK